MSTSTTDPFLPSGAITTGSWYNQTSTMSIVYLPENLPTPWPWLVASFAISIFLSLVSIISGLKRDVRAPISEVNQADRSLKTPYDTVSAVPVTYPTVRENVVKGTILSRILLAISLTITSFRVFSLLSIYLRARHVSAPLPAPSALILLVFSTTTYIFSTAGILRIYAYALSVMVIILANLVNRGVGLRSKDDYGSFTITGGNCPSAECNPGLPNMDVLGCAQGLPLTVQYLGVIARTEGIMGIIGASYLGIWLVYVTAVWVWHRLRSLLRSMPSLEPKAPWKVVLWETFLRPWATNSSQAWAFTVVTLFLSIIIAAIILPIHVIFQQRGETISYLDGFGPEVTGTYLHPAHPNSTLWRDCFIIRSPSDKLGFWDYWKKEKGHEAIDHFIAVL